MGKGWRNVTCRISNTPRKPKIRSGQCYQSFCHLANSVENRHFYDCTFLTIPSFIKHMSSRRPENTVVLFTGSDIIEIPSVTSLNTCTESCDHVTKPCVFIGPLSHVTRLTASDWSANVRFSRAFYGKPCDFICIVIAQMHRSDYQQR